MKTGEEKNPQLLLIDDDAEYCQLVKDYMELQAFNLEFCLTGQQGLEAVEKKIYDLILLDMMLPDIPGVDVLRQLRAKTGTPVVIFSAHNAEIDRIVTLELGADDYIPKSFSSRELLARVRVVLRRTSGYMEPRHDMLSLHGIELTPRTLRASFNGRPFDLTYVEYQILYALLREPGRVFSREALLTLFTTDKEWNKYDRSVDVHISSLRRKLAEVTGMNGLIRTVRGMGYTFIRQDEA